MNETQLTRKILKALRTKRGGRWVKIHGHAYQEAGISDILGCYKGTFYALEIKLPHRTDKDSYGSAIQRAFILDIIEAGGKGKVIKTVEEALKFVK